jgi:hypothetical protein
MPKTFGDAVKRDVHGFQAVLRQQVHGGTLRDVINKFMQDSAWQARVLEPCQRAAALSEVGIELVAGGELDQLLDMYRDNMMFNSSKVRTAMKEIEGRTDPALN